MLEQHHTHITNNFPDWVQSICCILTFSVRVIKIFLHVQHFHTDFPFLSSFIAREGILSWLLFLWLVHWTPYYYLLCTIIVQYVLLLFFIYYSFLSHILPMLRFCFSLGSANLSSLVISSFCDYSIFIIARFNNCSIYNKYFVF